jgi:hypothetical protein
MKKIELSNLGGHPLKTDNFTHLMGGVVETFDNLCKGVAYQQQVGFRLWGVNFTVLTSTDATWTAGAIYLQGEICNVDAGSASKTGVQVFKWSKVTTALPIDPQTYADASSRDVHLETKAVLVAAATFTFGLDLFPEADRLIDIVAPTMVTINPPSNHITAEDSIGDAVAYSVGFVANEVRFRVVNKVMTVDYRISGSLAATAETIFLRLPASAVCDGEYSSTLFFNDNAVRVKAENGQNKVRVLNGLATFSGSFELAGQLTLKVA